MNVTAGSGGYRQYRRHWLDGAKSWLRDGSLQSWSVRAEWRQSLLVFCFVLAFAVAGVRVALVAWSDPTEPRAVLSDSGQWSQRAPIVDRNGVVLAANLPTYSLYAHPHEISNEASRRRVARKLAALFDDLDEDTLYARFADGRKFLWLKQRLTPEQRQAVHDMGEPGIHMGPRETRVYPNGRMAAHILGGTSYGKQAVYSAEVIGTSGVEKAKDRFLRDPGKKSQPLVLSIDSRAQTIVSEKLKAAISVYSAQRGSAVLMDAHSGEIVAMVSLPDFDPNNRANYVDQDSGQESPLFCNAVQGVFEFGSTFKIFAAAQAIELGLVNADTLVSNRNFKIGKYQIKATEHDDGDLTVRDVIAKSSNAGSAGLALRIGKERQQQFLSDLGLLDVSGLELVEAGKVQPLRPRRWGDLETATISYGHGIAVSQVHLAAAYSSLVNGGYRVKPTIIKGGRADSPRVRVISEKTSVAAVEMLRAVVAGGTARSADLGEYSVGGKTGTADKPKPGGGYYKDKVLATFAAVFPTEDPRYVLIVTLDDATSGDGTKWARSAGKTAAPTAGVIISEVSPLLGIRPKSRETAEVGG